MYQAALSNAKRCVVTNTIPYPLANCSVRELYLYMLVRDLPAGTSILHWDVGHLPAAAAGGSFSRADGAFPQALSASPRTGAGNGTTL
eukprot:scaffold217001_cov38-Prasinocladus_malaysianus.AAC.1